MNIKINEIIIKNENIIIDCGYGCLFLEMKELNSLDEELKNLILYMLKNDINNMHFISTLDKPAIYCSNNMNYIIFKSLENEYYIIGKEL